MPNFIRIQRGVSTDSKTAPCPSNIFLSPSEIRKVSKIRRKVGRRDRESISIFARFSLLRSSRGSAHRDEQISNDNIYLFILEMLFLN